MGKVTDEQSQPLAYANVIVRLATDNTIVSFVQTDYKGEYVIDVGIGTWCVEFSLLSYEKTNFTITIGEQEIVCRDVVMLASSFLLDEVEIIPQLPIQIKNDTIAFNVSSFLRGNERVVEDVIKNLPGIGVSDNGIISVQGKEIEKVLLEGDDLLGKGYMLLTKGLNVMAVNQIEVINKYSENCLTKDIINSDKVALNLKLDESSKYQWIGMVNAAVGVKNKYDGHLNLLKVAKANKHYIIGHLNNIGNRIIDDLSWTLNQGSQVGLLVGIEDDAPDINLERYNFNNEKVISGSSIWHPTDKVKVEMNNSFSVDSRNRICGKSQTFNVDTHSFTHHLNKTVDSNIMEYAGGIKTNICLYESSMITTATHLLLKKNKLVGNSTFDEQNFCEDLNNKQTLVLQSINYTNRLAANNLLAINAIYRYQNLPQAYFVKDGGVATENLYQKTQTVQNNFEVSVGFVSNLSKLSKIHLSTNLLCQSSQFKTKLLMKEQSYIPFSNHVYGLSLIYTFRSKNLELRGGGDIEYQNVKMGNLIKSYIYPIPFISLDWKINSKHAVKTIWTLARKIPEWTECFPYSIRTSIDSKQIGSGQIDLLSNMVGSVEYQYGNWEDIFLANLKFSYIKDYLFYGVEQKLNSDYVETQYIPLKGREMYSISGNVDYYISPISTNIKLTGSIERVFSKYRIKNLGLFPYRYSSRRIGVSLKSVFQGIFNFDLGSAYHSTCNKMTHFRYEKIHTFGNLFLSLKRFKMELNGSSFYLKNNTQHQFSHYFFLDSEISYNIEPNVCTIFIRGNNLTNIKEYSKDIFNEISSTHIIYALQPRNILIGVEYRF